MFFKKREQDILNKISEERDRSIKAEKEIKQHLEQQIEQKMEQKWELLHSAVSKHNMAVEDLIEEWEEKRTDEDQMQETLSEYKKGEEKFLRLFEVYLDQFFQMKRFVYKKDEAWIKQFQLMEEQIEQYQQLCGIALIHLEGGKVDYNRYEVIEVVETEDENMDQKVAQIYSCGYIYKGTVKRKAKVSVYQVRREK